MCSQRSKAYVLGVMGRGALEPAVAVDLVGFAAAGLGDSVGVVADMMGVGVALDY